MKLFKLKKKKYFLKNFNKKYKPYVINLNLKKYNKEFSFNYREN